MGHGPPPNTSLPSDHLNSIMDGEITMSATYGQQIHPTPMQLTTTNWVNSFGVVDKQLCGTFWTGC